MPDTDTDTDLETGKTALSHADFIRASSTHAADILRAVRKYAETTP